MMMTLLLAMLLPMVKVAVYLVPLAGIGYGDASEAYDQDRFNNCQVTDLGTKYFSRDDDLLLDYVV